MTTLIICLCILALFVVVIAIANIRIVPQAYAVVIERLGSYFTTWGNGLHLKIPFIDRYANTVSLKEQVADFPPQPVITKDNVTIQIDTVVYYCVIDPKLYTYGVENPISAIENLTATTLRNIIGDLELDATLTSRDDINCRMQKVLDEATDPWGIKVKRVELKNIMPPREIQEAMEKQMKAERERRAKILDAEGERNSQILIAEGLKESTILKAEATEQARIKEAKGEAEAIKLVKQAEADSLELLNNAKPTAEVLQLKSYEAMVKVADGRSTKLIIPSELTNIANTTSFVKEIFKDNSPAKE